MTKVLLLILPLLLCGCADYATNANIDGVRGPGDLMPQEFPSPPPTADSHN